MASRKNKHTPEENQQRLDRIADDMVQQCRERSIAAKERALDFLEQSNRRARWLESKTRALEILNDTPIKKRARESTARAKEMLKRLERDDIARRAVAETERWIAAEIARQRRER